MNYKEGFDRLSVVASVVAGLLTLFGFLTENDWMPPTKGEGMLLLALSAIVGIAVWGVTRVIGWIVRGFIQQRREPPA